MKVSKRRTNRSDETMFQTRHLKRELLSQMHMLKAARNARRGSTKPLCTVDHILNEALSRGLNQLRQMEEATWISPH